MKTPKKGIRVSCMRHLNLQRSATKRRHGTTAYLQGARAPCTYVCVRLIGLIDRLLSGGVVLRLWRCVRLAVSSAEEWCREEEKDMSRRPGRRRGAFLWSRSRKSSSATSDLSPGYGRGEGFGPWHQGFHGAGRLAAMVEDGGGRRL